MSGDVAAENSTLHAQNGGNCEVQAQTNGVTNGHHNYHHSSSSRNSGSKHKSSSKDKHRDKERDRDREHKSSKDHHKSSSSSRDKDKHHSSSSSGKDKHRDKDRDNNSHRNSSVKDKEKDKERDKDKHKSSAITTPSSSSNHHHHHKSSSKDKDRKDKDKDKDKPRSERKDSASTSSNTATSKDKDGCDTSGRSKEHDRERHGKLSSSSSSRDKNKDKQRSSSSSGSHKHSSSSSSSKSKHSSSRHSSTSGAADTNNIQPSFDGPFIKPEPVSQVFVDSFKQEARNGFESTDLCNGYKNGYEELSAASNNIDIIKKETNDDNFNISQASSCDYSMSQFKSDEPPFVVKQEASYTDDSMQIYNQDEEFEREENENDDEDDDDDDDEEDEDVEKEDEDVPLAVRKRKPAFDDDDEDYTPDKNEANGADEDVPLLSRKKIKKETKEKSVSARKRHKEEELDDDTPKSKKKKSKKENAEIKTEGASTKQRVKKEKKEEDEEVWRWWEEEKREDGVKWSTLEHKGPVFAPLYERVPKNVHFFYNGKPMDLSEASEEAATFYAKMLNHDYCTKDIFNNNFFKDFRRTMTAKERDVIKDFTKCNFEEMHKYFLAESEKRKAATKEEKLAKKLENENLIKEYGFCMIDGHKEKIGNFRLEPPGLFRGRGEHPKMGMIKRRIQANDVSINCGKHSKIPTPPPGQRWKEIRHDNTVTWLASWVENVQGQVKYIMLNPSSKLKGEKDHVKYETARRLAKSIDKIRSTYRDEWKSKEMRVRQRAVALYFIDILALRAGNEKDEDQADTVGCCSLRVEHVQLHKQLNGRENVVVFDFLGKDSIRYYNEVEVEKRVFKNLELFMENKKEGDDLFDRLNTQVLNEHLKELMDGLTAKVFRTYNASITLQNQLDLLTEDDMTVPEKLLAYNRANRAVAILCNHQRSVPKGHQKSMDNLKEKIRAKREAIDDCESEYHDLAKQAKRGSVKEKFNADKKAKQLERLKEQLKKLELQETDRDENKTIALGTSKLNYLDPRISVAWCKKNQVPIEKIFNKTQRTKFLWAIHMADENYRF